MSIKLTLTLVIFSLVLIFLISYLLNKGRITVKYALVWYISVLIILILSFFPGIFKFFARLLGFQLVSNMVIVLLIGILFILMIAHTIMMAGQKKKTTLLIQEVSLLKKEVEKSEKRK